MNVCRICLANNINKLSIYETEQGISYYSMLIFVANIKKIMKDSCEYICLACCKKLRDLYNFKLLIERSEMQLNQYSNIFKFNNINEIKVNISKFNSKPKNLKTEFKKFCQNGESYASYNNTFIKRIKFESEKPKVLDREQCNDYDKKKEKKNCTCLQSTAYNIDCKDVSHEIYVINLQNSHSTFHYKERDNYDENIKTEHKGNRKYNVCIKPTYLKDVRVMKTSTTKNVGKSKPIYRNREDICPYCGKRMKIIRKHLLLHTAERKFKCNECPRSFYTKKDLESHIKSHYKEPAFKCDNCIAVFQTKAALARHMLVHTNVKDFKCHICSKAFKWKNGLLRHMQIHNISREFKCEICEMSFSNKYNFQHHTRVHTGERPYRCELCSRPYSYKRDFNKHCLKKHGVVIDRRPVRVMNDQVLQKEKALMKNLMLKLHGIPTENDPRDSFKGPQGAQALTKVLKLLQTCPLQIDVHL